MELEPLVLYLLEIWKRMVDACHLLAFFVNGPFIAEVSFPNIP